MIEINGKPILEHIMKCYSRFGFNEFILCGGYKVNIIKDYLYVDDVLNAYYKLFLTTNSLKNKNLFIYNIGSKYNYSVLDICKKILSILKVKNLEPIIVNNSKIEIFYQKLNYSKAKKDIKWDQKVKLDTSIKNSFKWYKLNFKHFRKYI